MIEAILWFILRCWLWFCSFWFISDGGAGMTVYELIQELAYFKADTPVFVKIRNTSTEFEVDSVDYEFHVVNAMVNGVTNRVKITIDG